VRSTVLLLPGFLAAMIGPNEIGIIALLCIAGRTAPASTGPARDPNREPVHFLVAIFPDAAASRVLPLRKTTSSTTMASPSRQKRDLRRCS